MSARPEIRLSRHMSSWDSEASVVITALRELLGPDAVDIQHIGSTAVRGILAVPVIDIVVGLAEDANVECAVEKLTENGFSRIKTDETGCIRMASRHRVHPKDAHHLYITRHKSPLWHDLITFRHYLNNHVFAANEYEELKKELAAQHRNNPKAYASGKTQFVKNILRLSFTDQFLGRHLTIVVDRPLGSQHPEHPNLKYELNYGFVPGIPTPNGKNLGAYIYGVHKPVRRFTGTVIAVVHRKNDSEDKLIVTPSGLSAYEPMLNEAVRFAERYYDTSLICIYEKSCGAIIYRIREDGVIEYLILYQHRSGTWSVPKGHIAKGETEAETALREIREETGLHVSLIDGFRKELSYTVSAKASKNVVIFLAQAAGELCLGENEISDALWADKATAIRKLGGRSIGRIIEAAEAFICARCKNENRPGADASGR